MRITDSSMLEISGADVHKLQVKIELLHFRLFTVSPLFFRKIIEIEYSPSLAALGTGFRIYDTREGSWEK